MCHMALTSELNTSNEITNIRGYYSNKRELYLKEKKLETKHELPSVAAKNGIAAAGIKFHHALEVISKKTTADAARAVNSMS